MNVDLEKAHRELLEKKIVVLTDKQFIMFKRLYYHTNLEASFTEVVNKIKVEDINSALNIIDRTVNKGK